MTASTLLRVLIIAGPNGAGKTTFANEFLPKEANCPHFINADLIAAGLSPFQPEAAAFRAGRLVLERIAAFVRQRQSFADDAQWQNLRAPDNAVARSGLFRRTFLFAPPGCRFRSLPRPATCCRGRP